MTRGEVWWVNFDPSLGGEIRKTRPAVIVSKTRLIDRMGVLSSAELREVERAIQVQLELVGEQ